MTCFNIGSVHLLMDNIHQAIVYIERCVEIKTYIGLPVESNRRDLEFLKAERDRRAGGGLPADA
jgi:hypothetical protein